MKSLLRILLGPVAWYAERYLLMYLGNNDPIYSKVGKIGTVAVTAANTSSQGGGTVGTDIFLLFSSDTTNGSFIREIRAMPTASAASTATTATVIRIFYGTVGSGATTSSNTHLLAEMSVASQTADAPTTPVFPIVVPLNFAMPASSFILVTNHAAPAASTQWKFIAIGGDY